MNFTIRTATVNDAREIALLSAQLGYDITAMQTTRNIEVINSSDSDYACVAVDGSKVVGWIQVLCTVRMECGAYCEITGLVIDQRYRGKGVGRLLINHIKPWCRERNTTRLLVRSNVKRAEAHQFYIKAGFTEVKQHKVFEAVV